MQWWILKRPIHISWLITVICIGIVAGVASAQYVPYGWFVNGVWLGVGVMGIVIVCRKRMVAVIGVALLAGLVIGLWRGSIDQQKLAVFDDMIGHSVRVEAKVMDDPEENQKNGFVLKLHDLRVNGKEIFGAIWASTTKRDVKRGDIVTLEGKMSEGFGSFAASMFRAKTVAVTRPEPGDVAGRVRDWFAGVIRTAISEPQASLGIGYLVGQKSALPEDMTSALQVAGLTHVVVASGYNLTILVRLARRVFVKISKYLSLFAAGSMIIAFIGVTGLSPSMSRAGLVAGLSLLAWYYGRKFHPIVLLFFVAAVTLLVHPGFAWGDLGWQLSFAAFIGVMIVAPLLQRYFFGEKEPGTIRQIIGETASAQLVTLPIILLAFGKLSNVALIANLLILPFVPLAMLLTFIAGIGAVIAPNTATALGVPAEALLTYMTTAAHYVASLPWAQSIIELNWVGAVISYVVMAIVCWCMWRKTGYNLRESNIVE